MISRHCRVFINGDKFALLSHVNVTDMFRKPRIFITHYNLFNFKSIRLKHEWIAPQGYDTGIRVHSRIANKKVPLILVNKNFVKWYICGPTVYDVSHIGHASCYVRFDLINRILRDFFNIKPIVALGITDIDDKIIKKSILKSLDFRALAKQHELEFLKELKELNVLPPTFILRVSEHIPEIIDFISRIVDRGDAYATDNGSVYFHKKSSIFFDKIKEPPPDVKSPLQPGQKASADFALWKTAKKGEPFWESPWGRGRPGWHIECSAMASKVFGSQLDLHSGGVDLVFPHHENEETQSCSYHNCNQWVNYWMHSGQLDVDDEKMSKSLHNFTSISDFLKNNTADHFRMYCFISQYGKGLHYGPDAMSLPVSTCNIITKFLADANAYVRGNWSKGNVSESSLLENLEETKEKVREHLMDDFNTSGCHQALMQLIGITVRMLNEEADASASRSPAAVAAVSQYIAQVCDSFGFQLSSVSTSQATGDDHKLEFILNQVTNFRNQIRGEAAICKEKPTKGNLFKACDSLRDELKTIGVVIKDQGKDSGTWSFADISSETEKTKAVN